MKIKNISFISFAILVLVFVFSSCNLLEQKKFAYLNKVPANPVTAEHKMDYPAPAEKMRHNDTPDNDMAETQEDEVLPNTNKDNKAGNKYRKKQVRKAIKNLMFPDFGVIKAKISTPKDSSTDPTGIKITLVSLAILIAIILYHVITKNSIGCASLIVIIFCIVFIIMGLVM